MSSLTTLIFFLTVILKIFLVVFCLLLARGLVWSFNLFIFWPAFDPLKNMPGPEGSPLQSHIGEVMDPNITPQMQNDWVKSYGKTFRFHGYGRHDYRLMSYDFQALSYILNSPVYEKPWQTRATLSSLVDQGVVTMEGEEHRAQRKIIGPAFTAQSVKALSPVIFQKAEELRDRWDALIQNSPASSPASAAHTVIDVCHWLSRATFDVIGLSGFDYHFNSLHDESEEMYLAYRRMFGVVDKGPRFTWLLKLYFPFVEKIWPDEDSRTTHECRRVIHAAGKKLIENKKAAILAEKSSASLIQEKDILSLLIKSNLSADPSKRMSDTDLLNQISTFLFAGSDSTSLGMTWCLHHLSLHPHIQTRLRDEVLSVPFPSIYSATSHADVLDSLSFLDAVVRETLRVSPPAHGSIRTAITDDLIPVSHAVHLRDGTIIPPGGHIPIRKGSFIHIPIEGLNLCEDIWGPDSRAFNPDRWFNLPPSARNHPGLCNLMTFSFGPHSCPGYRFSISEMKIFVATLISHFVFKPSEDIRMFNAIVTRPYVTDQFQLGSRLPMLVERYQH